MSGLSDREKKFVKDFLKIMNDESVRALAATVTRRMIKTDSRKDCIDAIILHSSSLDEFLKRQKVTKENLFKYLNARGISVPNTDKANLEVQIKDLVNEGNQEISHTPSNLSPVKQNLSPVSPAWTAPQQNCNQTVQLSQPNHQPPPSNFHLPEAAQVYLTAATGTRVTVQEKVTTTTYEHVSGASLLVNTVDPTVREISNLFVEWFYEKINQTGGLINEDFWSDAKLNLVVRRRQNIDSKHAQGAANVALLLKNILEEHQLHLYPNKSSEGLWAHGKGGVVLVLVCGTLHQRISGNHRPGNIVELGPLLGSFENLFLLAQDPLAAQNWKIKNLDVIFYSNPQIQQLPTLQDSELAKSIKF